MNRHEYAEYERAVAEFFERESISNLSSGHLTCPEHGCGAEWDEGDECPNGHGPRELWDEPFFSWRPCECCRRPLGGDRQHATGWNPTTREIQEYDICVDCLYYAEYGRLDDTTMLELETEGAS
jgi:hypothetical protein